MKPAEEILDEKARNAFCGMLQERFGIHLNSNNELLPMFYIGHRAASITEETALQSKENIEKIINRFEKNTSSKIAKLETKQYHFQNSKIAFCFAFGKYGVGWLASVFFLFIAWIFFSYQEKNNRATEYMGFLLEKTEVQERKVNDSTFVHLITLQPAKDLQASQAGKNYVFRKDCKCIEIPLYFQKTTTKKP